MAHYLSVGSVPPKRHTQHRDPAGHLYAEELMAEHGKSGRTFAGRIGQYITASAGLDDYEWGVTLFGVHPDDIKEVVYTMRFDVASSVYAEFGPFYTGMVVSVEDLVTTL